MTPWSYHNPVAVHFGAGALVQLRDVVGDAPCVLVTFPEARALGLEGRVAALLGDALADVVSDVSPNPDIAWLRERHTMSWHDHPQATLVAVGGGSVLDTAKALAVDSAGGFDALLHTLIAGREFVPARSRRMIAVPTTAGTGSEVTPWATLWDARAGRKLSLHCEACWPAHAIVDPELARSTPREVTRNTALDALSHALESIWNRNANPVSDRLALEAARTIIATLLRLLENPGDLALREAASRAALLAGLAFSNTKTALAHSISYEMTLRHGLPHGLACSFTLPLAWRMAQGHDSARDDVLAGVFGPGESAPADRLERFLHSVGVATRFEAYGVGASEACTLVTQAAAGVRGRNFSGHVDLRWLRETQPLAT